ncbi:Hypothetical predicted protein [Paramuricea clavata]|uniref:Uncharacterized protein n=3 Tax=Paramuricea clavata TaxID=317549 RepID=A0A6S7H7F3_PARCT|nr:Hypothetical predicted protein [Paramuricea clavata]
MAAIDDNVVGTTSDSDFTRFLKSISLEKHQLELEQMGIQSIDHLADVTDGDDAEFAFMTKFEFRRLIREYKQFCIETGAAKTNSPSGSACGSYKTSSQSVIVKLPKSFRNFFGTRDGMGNVVVGTSGLKSKYKNLWHDRPRNPSQVLSNSFVLKMAEERFKFAKSLRDCELWCRQERATRIKLLLATSKSPAIDEWTEYYKKQSIYGQIQEIQKRFPATEAIAASQTDSVTLNIYEKLCKYQIELVRIEKFAINALHACEGQIRKPPISEEWQEPNEFYLHHLPLLQEAVEHVSTKVTALKAKVEMAAEKHKKTASHNKIQQRRQAKRAKLHAIINVTEGPGDDCHVVETSDCDGADNDSVVIENDVEEL